MSMILSIQSHVAFGYVGNRAAVFPLQVMGHEVAAVNTVQFSNHTGYGNWTGMVFQPDHIHDVISGLEQRGVLRHANAILSGYLGDAALGAIVMETVEKARAHNPQLLFCCDPVMGDIGRGFFVKDDIPPFFKSHVHHADILVPNQFELTALTGHDIVTLDDIIRACDSLLQQGSNHILVTSVETQETPTDTIQMLLYNKQGGWIVTTPKIPFDIPPNGAGDMTSAVFLGYILSGHSPADALALTASSVYCVFEKTALMQRRELAITQALDCFMMTAPSYKAVKIL